MEPLADKDPLAEGVGYSLVAVVSHHGASLRSGHWLCDVAISALAGADSATADSSPLFFQINDTTVTGTTGLGLNYQDAVFGIYQRVKGEGKGGNEGEGKAKMLTETININSSLLALGACVSALQARAAHVPYKNSKLTNLLSEALGGKDSRTLILCTLNPLHSNASESLSTLRFAANCAAVAKK
jgi:hypothetical protein